MQTKDDPWYVYIVQCADNSLYTGITKDVKRRLDEHNHSGKGARYTRPRRPVKLVYASKASTHSDAAKHEFLIKKMSKKMKQQLIQNGYKK